MKINVEKLVLVSVFLFMLTGIAFGQKKPGNEKTEQNSKRIEWWKDAKFGLFLHWGLYSQAAGDWKGKPYRGNEHFMIYEKLSLKEYGSLANDFNPTLFNAEKWVKNTKMAGMKYVVITTKHHDGFAMYNSPSSSYNIVNRSPFKRDPLKELAEACKKNDLKLGFYYSLGRDWEDPDCPTDWPTKGGRSNLVDYPNEDAKDFSKYFERKVKPQIRELLTQYGPVGVLWFDTPEGILTEAQSKELLQLIRTLQPDCIVNNRISGKLNLGDYKVSEQQITDKIDYAPWESCITMSKGWGYNKHDTSWKNPELLVRQLVEIVCKGGNLLLNIGPKSDGTFPDEAVERLKDIGKWMEINNEAIYGVKPWMVAGELISESTLSNQKVKIDVDNDATSKVIAPDIYFASKGKTVYVFARSWKDPIVNVANFAAGKQKIKSIKMLGSSSKIKWKQSSEKLTINMPENLPAVVPIYVFKIIIE